MCASEAHIVCKTSSYMSLLIAIVYVEVVVLFLKVSKKPLSGLSGMMEVFAWRVNPMIQTIKVALGLLFSTIEVKLG